MASRPLPEDAAGLPPPPVASAGAFQSARSFAAILRLLLDSPRPVVRNLSNADIDALALHSLDRIGEASRSAAIFPSLLD